MSGGLLSDQFNHITFNAGNLPADIALQVTAAGGYSSSHMNFGGKGCAGGNTLCQDNHVEWKPMRTLSSMSWDSSRYEWFYRAQ